jgi:hypothetical protein
LRPINATSAKITVFFISSKSTKRISHLQNDGYYLKLPAQVVIHAGSTLETQRTLLENLLASAPNSLRTEADLRLKHKATKSKKNFVTCFPSATYSLVGKNLPD